MTASAVHVQLDDPGVTVAQDHGATSLALHLLGLIAQHVTLVGNVGTDFAGTGQAEALLDSAFGLHLGHFSVLDSSGPARFHMWAGLLLLRVGMPGILAVTQPDTQPRRLQTEPIPIQDCQGKDNPPKRSYFYGNSLVPVDQKCLWSF
ncbi:hypothetical protein AY555_02380 [Haematospirillum jordaniae]|uniref:Uncharacterized protein n=1 Tax=Haematospirillum jordaniae TaxID=1549855 RepID=A0A143DBX1_9PROT|nr:hypothetical protein AY555_02380 [Haematospirillum jordaniae]